MDEFINIASIYVAQIVEVLAAIVIACASAKAFLEYSKSAILKTGSLIPDINIRLNLGKSLAVALELLLGADILKTAITPSWDEIGKLAAIATLRTALNYFLERELKNKPE